MGTSRDYGGSPNWGGVKAAVARTAGEGPLSGQKTQRIVRNFVSNMQGAPRGGFTGGRGGGGGGGAGGGGGGGRRGGRRHVGGGGLPGVAASVGSFLSDVKERGLELALKEIGIDGVEGKEPGELILLLADILGGPGSLIDEVDLRSALTTLLRELCKAQTDLEGVETALQGASMNLEQVVRNLFGHYIFERFNTTMCARLDGVTEVPKSDNYLAEVRRYIDTQLALEGDGKDLTRVDWKGSEGAKVVDYILQDTIRVFTD
jgi:hypothetical protein